MSQTAERYSKTLFELSQEQKNLEAMQGFLTELKGIITDSKDFRLFLSNPLLSYEERCTVLKALFENKIPDLAFRFLLFITYKGRLNILEAIIDSFDTLYLSHAHQIRALVQTALPINEQDKAFINQHLHDKLKQEILSQWTVDPSLIGGFRIFVQGKLYDYSFKTQLNHFFQQSTQPV